MTDAIKMPVQEMPTESPLKQSFPKKEPLFKLDFAKITREIVVEIVHKPLNLVNMDPVMDAVCRKFLPHYIYLIFAKKIPKNNYILLTKHNEFPEEVIPKHHREIEQDLHSVGIVDAPISPNS